MSLRSGTPTRFRSTPGCSWGAARSAGHPVEPLERRLCLSASHLFRDAVTYDVGHPLTSVASDEFNDDGFTDIVAAGPDGVFLLFNEGDKHFAPAVQASTTPSTSMMVADFNGDFRDDLALANPAGTDVVVLLQKGDGTFVSPVVSPAGLAPSYLASGDFNGDGFIDLVASGDRGVTVLLGTGDGGFGAPVRVDRASAGPFGGVAVADVNNDGTDDFAVSVRGAVKVFPSRGDGTFARAARYAVGSGRASPGVVLASFGPHDASDLAVTDPATDTVYVLRGRVDRDTMIGNGKFGPPRCAGSGTARRRCRPRSSRPTTTTT